MHLGVHMCELYDTSGGAEFTPFPPSPRSSCGYGNGRTLGARLALDRPRFIFYFQMNYLVGA